MYSSAFVCIMGMGIVFFGLICLILLTSIMGRIVGSAVHQAPAQTPAAPVVPAAAPAAPEPDRQKMIAAVSAAIAEELGTDITGIRILSVKKL